MVRTRLAAFGALLGLALPSLLAVPGWTRVDTKRDWKRIHPWEK